MLGGGARISVYQRHDRGSCNRRRETWSMVFRVISSCAVSPRGWWGFVWRSLRSCCLGFSLATAQRLVSVANGVRKIAPILWGQYEASEVQTILLKHSTILADGQHIQSFSTLWLLDSWNVDDGFVVGKVSLLLKQFLFRTPCIYKFLSVA